MALRDTDKKMESYLRDIRNVLCASEQTYRNIARCGQSATATLNRHDLPQISSLIRDISAILYQIHLTLSTVEDDGNLDTGQSFSLGQIHRCQRLLDELNAAIGDCLLGGLQSCPLGTKKTETLHHDLAHTRAQLRLALAAATPFAALRALSQPEQLATAGQADVEIHLPDRLPANQKRDISTVRGMPDPVAVARWSDSRLNTYLRLRTPDSLDLIFQEPLIQGWLEGRVARLWLHGEPGSGKTVLASSIVEKLMNQTKHDSTIAVCYHLFDQPSPSGTASDVLLAGLIGQLSQQSPVANRTVKAALNPGLITKHALGESKSSSRWKTDCLGHVFESLKKVYKNLFIVVDGVDECGSESMEVLYILHNYLQACKANGAPATSILVLSREPPDADSPSGPKRGGYEALDVTPDPAQIKAYVRGRLQKRASINPSFSAGTEEVERTVEAIGSATRLFRVAELQVDYLQSLSSDKERSAALPDLPTDLQRLYTLFLSGLLDQHEKHLVYITVRWLQVLGPGDLSLRGLSEAISIFLAKGATILAHVTSVSETQILSCCIGLVRATLDGSAIELAHGSVRDICPAHRPSARCEIGIACLRILNLRDITHSAKEFRLERECSSRRDASHPFYRYAVEAWMDMLPVDTVERTLEKELMEEACRLFSSIRPQNLISWVLELGDRRFVAVYPLSPVQTFMCLTNVSLKYKLSPIHIAACLGLSLVCSALVKDGLSMNARSDLGTPLYCALAGPALLLSDALNLDWEIARRHFRLESRLRTAEKLIELGARPDSLSPASEKRLSFAAVTLMACAARSGPRDIKLFTSLCTEEMYLADEHFLTIFKEPGFPFEPSNSGSGVKPSVPQQKQFLDDLCSLLIDGSWNKRVASLWSAAWQKGLEHNLDCTSPTRRRRIPVDDKVFSNAMNNAIQSASELDIRFCMQDTRWNPNLPLTGMAEEDRGRTLLHRAVEDGNVSLVKLILDRGGADLSISDASGRTALHLCERSDVLGLLVASGADLRHTDNDGRLLWHYAAANSDLALLQTLVRLDPDSEWALKQTTKQGRTPLAEALAFVSELNGLPVPASRYPQFLAEKELSIWFILDLIDDDDAAYLRSDIPVLCYAAEWGSQELVTAFRDRFSVLELKDQDDSNPLHYLNFYASAGLIREIRRIPGIADLPVLNRAGRSPAETIFFAFKPSLEEPNENAHPSNNANLDKATFMELVTEEMWKSTDGQGRSLKKRFHHDIVRHYMPIRHWMHVRNAIITATHCFVAKGMWNDSS